MESKILSTLGIDPGIIFIVMLVLIIVLFSGLIATISYNIYISNSSIKRMSKATNYIIDTFEYIDKINYDDVTNIKIKTETEIQIWPLAVITSMAPSLLPVKCSLQMWVWAARQLQAATKWLVCITMVKQNWGWQAVYVREQQHCIMQH